MDIYRFLKIFGNEHSELGYTGKRAMAGEKEIQKRLLLETMATLGIQMPGESEDLVYHRELNSPQDRLWVLKDGELTPYELKSLEEMHRDMDEGTVFVVRPSHRMDAAREQRETPEPLRFLFSARYNTEWALLNQDSAGLAAMAGSLAEDPLEDLDNAGGFLKALGDFFISILDKLMGGGAVSTYRHDRTEAQKLAALREVGQRLEGKVFEVGEDGRLIVTDPPRKVEVREQTLSEKVRNTVPDREVEVPLDNKQLLDEGYRSGEKAFPGMEDLHERYRELGSFDSGGAKGLAGIVTNLENGYQPEIRGIITLIGGNSDDYAPRKREEQKGFSPEDVRSRVIDIVLDPPQAFTDEDRLNDAWNQKTLSPQDREAAKYVRYTAGYREDVGERAYGDKLYDEMMDGRVRGLDTAGATEKIAKRAIGVLIHRQVAQPRLGERNIRLAQLAMQICHWAYAQNMPLNLSSEELKALRGQLILADVTRKGLAAREQLKQGLVTDENLKDYYAMKALEQPVLAAHQQNGGKSGRSVGTAEVFYALGDPKTGTPLMENIYTQIQAKLSTPEERKKLEELVNGTDQARDEVCLGLYTDVIDQVKAARPKKKIKKRVNFQGLGETKDDQLTFTERSRFISTTIIEDQSAEALKEWKIQVETVSEEKKREMGDLEGLEREKRDIEKKLKGAKARHEKHNRAAKEGLYVSYHKFSKDMTTSDLPGKKKEEEPKEESKEKGPTLVL